MNVSLSLLAAPLVLLSACATSDPDLEVGVFRLKETRLYEVEMPVVRAEQQKRLRGAVEEVDRRARLGEYFTVDWNRGKADALSEPVRVVFLYRQAATASKVHTVVQEYPATQRKGVTEFSVVGDQFQENGRVLNWRSELYSGDQLLVHEQSYLWQ